MKHTRTLLLTLALAGSAAIGGAANRSRLPACPGDESFPIDIKEGRERAHIGHAHLCDANEGYTSWYTLSRHHVDSERLELPSRQFPREDNRVFVTGNSGWKSARLPVRIDSPYFGGTGEASRFFASGTMKVNGFYDDSARGINFGLYVNIWGFEKNLQCKADSTYFMTCEKLTDSMRVKYEQIEQALKTPKNEPDLRFYMRKGTPKASPSQ